MKDQRVEAVLQKVARSNGVSVDHVRREIQYAMEEGMASPDPLVQAEWALIPRKGEKPTVDEFIIYLANKYEESKL